MGVLRSDRVSGLGGANAINGSVHFPNDGATGTGDYLRVDRKDNSDFNLGTNDFTMEFWFNSENVGSTLFPFAFAAPTVSASSDAGFYVRFNGGAVNFNCFEGNNTIGACTTGSVNIETWYHVAYVRSGSTFTVYLDGTSAATASSAEAVNYNAGWNFNIGSAYTNVYHYNGFLSNLRIVNGTALYTSNFTVPNRRLEAVENTVLLCCQSPGNVLQEASGKTLHTIGLSLDSKSVPSTVHASRFTPDVGEDYGTTFGENTVLDTLSYMVPPGGTTAQSNRGRGVVLGGGRSGSPTKINTISYLEIPSTGISNDFGDLTESVIIAGCCASSTRGVRGGGYNTPTNSDTIDYVTIATTSNATDFGNLTQARHWVMGGGSQTRGIFGGGNAGASPNPNTNVIDYITIASEGNAADFGDLINSYTPTIGSGNAAASPTRLLFAGGSQDVPAPATVQNVIQYVTIASTGDATDFGDLTDNKVRFGVCSSSTRALYGGAGGSDAAKTNSITYVTIATTGNTVDFGDRTVGVNNVAATSNSLRGVFIGGLGSPTSENHIDYVTIATTGNAADWGDSFYVLEHTSACSDSHGGIS